MCPPKHCQGNFRCEIRVQKKQAGTMSRVFLRQKESIKPI